MLDVYAHLLCPILDTERDTVGLGRGRVAKESHNVMECIHRLPALHHHLERANTCTSLARPVVGIGVEPLENIERLGSDKVLLGLLEN